MTRRGTLVAFLMLITYCNCTKNFKLVKVAKCIAKAIAPPQDLTGLHIYTDKFLSIFSQQWDAYDNKEYLILNFTKYQGADAWAASCQRGNIENIKTCLEYLTAVDLNNIDMYTDVIYSAFFFLKLCEYKSVLADPSSEHAICVYKRILHDDVQRCTGVYRWLLGNLWLVIDNRFLPEIRLKQSQKMIADQVYTCIYVKGKWKIECGPKVDRMMLLLSRSFSTIEKRKPLSQFAGFPSPLFCDVCQSTDNKTLRIYQEFVDKMEKIIKGILLDKQGDLFRYCKVIKTPLSSCHTRRIWKRAVYDDFCHELKTFIIVAKPHLPISSVQTWIQSASNICQVGYKSFIGTASHIGRCIHEQDELFPCYRGFVLDSLTSGLITAGRMWRQRLEPVDWHKHSLLMNKEYPYFSAKIKRCADERYNLLEKKCKHGKKVVPLIKDLRVLLKFDLNSIFSQHIEAWESNLRLLEKNGVHVPKC